MADILCDSREKKPLVFPGKLTETVTLKAGDYSRPGLREWVSVERKGPMDWAGCCYTVKSRERLRGQLGRLVEQVRFPLLIIEEPPAESQMARRLRSSRPRRREELLEWAWALEEEFRQPIDDEGLPEQSIAKLTVQFAATPRHAARLTESWLFARRCKNCGAHSIVCNCGCKQEI